MESPDIIIGQVIRIPSDQSCYRILWSEPSPGASYWIRLDSKENIPRAFDFEKLKASLLTEAPNTPRISGHLLKPAAFPAQKPHRQGTTFGVPSGRWHNANLMSIIHPCARIFSEKRNRIPA